MGQQRPESRIAQFLDTNGDGSGTVNATGNYASAATDFYFEAAEDCFIYRMIVSIEDTSGMQADEYGNLGAALTNGWELKVKDASDVVLSDETAGVAVKTNAGIGRNCFDVDVKSWGITPTDELLVARWTFEKDSQPLFLRQGDKLVIALNDNFTGLVDHYFMVKGELANTQPELGTENHIY